MRSNHPFPYLNEPIDVFADILAVHSHSEIRRPVKEFDTLAGLQFLKNSHDLTHEATADASMCNVDVPLMVSAVPRYWNPSWTT